jgi:ABC-type transporter Mla MlaB component
VPAQGEADPPPQRAAEHAAPAVLHLTGCLSAAHVPDLCARLNRVLPGAASLVVDVAAVERVDLGVLEALARLQLTAKRAGRTIALRGVRSELRALVALAGLDEALETG